MRLESSQLETAVALLRVTRSDAVIRSPAKMALAMALLSQPEDVIVMFSSLDQLVVLTSN